MRFLVRVAMGIVLGLAAVVGLAFFFEWWLNGIISSILALVVFLGSFFLWSADRPEDGYEQVLFDKTNTLISGVMILAFVGAAFGAGWLFAPQAAQATVDPLLAELDYEQDGLDAIAKGLQDDADAFTKSEIDAAEFTARLGTHKASIEDSKTAIAAIEPGAYAAKHEKLGEQAEHLAATVAAHENCLANSLGRCVDAQLALADRSSARKAYFEA